MNFLKPLLPALVLLLAFSPAQARNATTTDLPAFPLTMGGPDNGLFATEPQLQPGPALPDAPDYSATEIPADPLVNAPAAAPYDTRTAEPLPMADDTLLPHQKDQSEAFIPEFPDQEPPALGQPADPNISQFHEPSSVDPVDEEAMLHEAALNDRQGNATAQTPELEDRYAQELIDALAARLVTELAVPADNATSANATAVNATLPHGLDNATLAQTNGTLEQPNQGFSVQLGAYRSKINALNAMEAFRRKGYEPFIAEERLDDDGVWYAVRIGSHPTYEDAANAARAFMDKENHPALVKAPTL